MNGYIYIIKNNINNKVYIGKTLGTLEKRFKEHCRDSKTKSKEKRPLYSAMNKYGIEHFSIELLEECSIDILEERECFWINCYNSYKNGYNATLGGDGKQRCDYSKILNFYQKGKTIIEISKITGYCQDTIRKALKSNGIENPSLNAHLRNRKKITVLDKDNTIIRDFQKIEDAAIWIKQTTQSNASIKSISSNIGRASKGERKSAYGYYWRLA